MSKIVKSQIESNSQHWVCQSLPLLRCVKDRQITNWKQFTTVDKSKANRLMVCQRSSNHKLKAIHNIAEPRFNFTSGVSKIVKSQIESNSQLILSLSYGTRRCVKDRQITNWKQFTTPDCPFTNPFAVCQRSSNHKLKAIHNWNFYVKQIKLGVSKIVKSQIESNSQPMTVKRYFALRCVKDRQITNWKQFTTKYRIGDVQILVCQRSSNHKLKAIHN